MGNERATILKSHSGYAAAVPVLGIMSQIKPRSDVERLFRVSCETISKPRYIVFSQYSRYQNTTMILH